MRNPFPKIGKVIKYEFKHSARTLLPLYGVLLVLGLLTGLSVNKNKYDKILSSIIANNSYEYNAYGQEAAKGFVTGLLFFAVVVLTVTVSVITIVGLARRFKQSMLGEEAYLNLSLPLTIGEQLWGRFIMNFLWLLCCGVVICASFLLCFLRMDLPQLFQQLRDSIPEMNQALMQQNLSLAKVTGLISLMTLVSCLWLITVIYVVNAISHLFKNNKGLVKFLAIIVILWINAKTASMFSFDSAQMFPEHTAYYFVRNSLLFSGITFVWAGIYFAFTQFVFTKKLNLE